MKQTKFLFSARVKSFSYAFSGFTYVLRNEHNAWIHAAATTIVIAAGALKGLSTLHWVGLWLAIGLVWISELFNTCIEILCDLYCDNKYHPVVKTIKDIAAGAVLVAALVSIIIGFLIFTS